MSTTKERVQHAPGPFEAISIEHGRGWYIKDTKGRVVAMLTNYGTIGESPAALYCDELEANAHLIAAAPELLALLSEANETGFANDNDGFMLTVNWLERVRDAIAKAQP